MKKQGKKKSGVVIPSEPILPADPYVLGRSYFIRTVTMYHVGRVVAIYPQELVLEDAAWIADAGKLGELLATGKPPHYEPYPDGPIFVNRGGIIDVCEWKHPLLRLEKKVEETEVVKPATASTTAGQAKSAQGSNVANTIRD